LITYNQGAKFSQRGVVIYASPTENARFLSVSDQFENQVSILGLQKTAFLPIAWRAMRLPVMRLSPAGFTR